MPESTPDEQAEQSPLQEFAAWLVAVNNGVTHAELTDALPRLVRASLDSRKQSTLTLKVVVKPMSGNESQVQVSAQVDEKLPPGDAAQTLMFVDDFGNLTRDDPRAMTIPGLGVVRANTASHVIRTDRKDH